MRAGRRAGPAEIVTAALQAYAERGVFRGFSAVSTRGGQQEYAFRWLLQRPFELTFDPKRNVLVFKQLFPEVDARSPMVAALKGVVDDRASRRVPVHKRFDGRRIRAACTVRRRAVAVEMHVRGGHHAFAVRHLLNLVNDLFLVLHETYPDYLITHFGLSPE
jgi:hypothetical protein